MDTRTLGRGTVGISAAQRRLAIMAIAGIVAPILFASVVITLGLLDPDYSHVRMPISALAAGPAGWIQSLTFCVFGVLFIAFAVGLHKGVRRAKRDVIGAGLLVVGGVGCFLLGAFPWRKLGGEFIEPAGHVIGVFMAFLGAGIGFIVFSLRLGLDPRWQSAKRYTLASGIAVIVLFFAFGGLAESPDTPLHPWAGLVQRVLVATLFACPVVLGLRLLTVARGVER